MLAFGAGDAEVALDMAGEPLRLSMPLVRGIRVTGALPDWVSAKDAVLELLRRHGLEGGGDRVFEYYGPALSPLSVMDRHVIASMGAGAVKAWCNDGRILRLRHTLSARQAEVLIAGGAINWLRAEISAATTADDEVSVPA